MRGIKILKNKLQSWRDKAKSRAKLIEKLRKRIIAMVVSRDMWRSRYYELKLENARLCCQLENLGVVQATKVAHHSYTAEQISLCLRLRHEGRCSYRSCVLVMKIFADILNMDWPIPSHSSVYNWDVKIGYAKLEEKPTKSKEYALIMDESISIGSEKILVISGVDLARYDFSRPLQMEDLKILDIVVGKSWKAKDISPRISELEKDNITFKYGCSDNAGNLRNALKDKGLAHIEDCGHALGNLMKNKYKSDSTFKAFSEALRKFRLRMLPSKDAEYVPPKWRNKGKYMNLWAVCNWAKKMLDLVRFYEKQSPRIEVFTKLKWLLDYAIFIEGLYAEQQVINRINKELKTYGLSKQTLQKSKKYIKELEDAALRKKMIAYLDRNWKRTKDLEKVVISSDIIESTFGKFKYRVASHPQGGITCGCLTIANYDKKVGSSEVKRFLEKVTNKEIEKWRAETIPISIFRKKKKLFKNTG